MQNIHKQIFSAVQQDHTTRKKLFREVEKHLSGRTLVSLFTSFVYPVQIEDQDCDMLQSVLQHTDTKKGIALMINSPGGDGLAAERIVNTLRAYSGTHDFWAIVPGKSKSAGTIIAMGASKILMAPSSELGPVDPQIFREEDGVQRILSAYGLVNGYDTLFQGAVQTNGNLEPFLQQLSHYDDRDINLYRSLVTLSKNIAVKLLGSGMMAGKSPADIENAIAMFLDPAAGTHSHGRPIYANEATSCGLNVETMDVASPLWRGIYELYARTDIFVSSQACKAVESREEAFYVGAG